MDIKKIVNSLVKNIKQETLLRFIKGMNVILVSVPLEGVRGSISIFNETILFTLMILFQNMNRFLFVLMSWSYVAAQKG